MFSSIYLFLHKLFCFSFGWGVDGLTIYLNFCCLLTVFFQFLLFQMCPNPSPQQIICPLLRALYIWTTFAIKTLDVEADIVGWMYSECKKVKKYEPAGACLSYLGQYFFFSNRLESSRFYQWSSRRWVPKAHRWVVPCGHTCLLHFLIQWYVCTLTHHVR